MAWPPPVLPVNRTDALYQQTNHPDDHNKANQAINDLVLVARTLAPGYVSHAFVGTEQLGIQSAPVTLTGVRCDYVEKPGHTYLFLFATQLRKSGGDSVGTAAVQMVHSTGGQLGRITLSMAVVPYYSPAVTFAVRSGAVAAPVNLVAQASTDAGYLNAGGSTLLVVDLGPYGP